MSLCVIVVLSGAAEAERHDAEEFADALGAVSGAGPTIAEAV
ncbi:MAG: hypothetical protein NT029_10585 [Armatimonadetes bacterium]|nr:hypothetical protein [Armatimonadota bacterium]